MNIATLNMLKPGDEVRVPSNRVSGPYIGTIVSIFGDGPIKWVRVRHPDGGYDTRPYHELTT